MIESAELYWGPPYWPPHLHLVCPMATQILQTKSHHSVIVLDRTKVICRKCCICFIVSNKRCACENFIHLLLSDIKSRQLAWYLGFAGGGWSHGFTETLTNSMLHGRPHEALNILFRGFICSFHTAITLALTNIKKHFYKYDHLVSLHPQNVHQRRKSV